MRLLMFASGQERRMGVAREVAADEIVDVNSALAGSTSSPAFADVQAVLDAGAMALEQLAGLAASTTLDLHSVRRLADLELLAPLDPPRGNILAVGRSYQRHAEEGARARNTEVRPPTIFTKAITTVTGPHAEIPIDDSVSAQMDWEVELGVIVGRRGDNIRRDDALDHVFGYTVLNDVTARDIQNDWGGQWFKGKSLDASCPMGPWIVTRDELPDPLALRLQLRINGELKQDGNTRDMIHPVDAIIEWLSLGMTLLPGTVIATGTPEGVGYARTPPEYLRPGDVMESEIAGIGLMRNVIVSAGGTGRA
jgi:2-keto-4-pentenoate hydratase/2-oxohepta-3-ene-1,7-dioic acid hydratase in catechol pathway